MQLDAFTRLLETLAPLALAEEWDNVGLLVCPSEPAAVERVLFTVDLTWTVFEEAQRWGANAIVAYHPALFSAFKRVTPSDRTGRLLLGLIENRIAVYSPHTALDAVRGGVNDWLAQAFTVARSRAILPRSTPADTDEASAPGQGRLLQLAAPLTLMAALERIKSHLGLSHLRYATAPLAGQLIHSVALCAGAGASVIQKVEADLYLTGEMRHHDVLSATQAGSHVILTEHSHSERGYLPVLIERLRAAGATTPELRVAESDREPLRLA
jgi:dinuclear metal center YbgI/SA1388 family protein